MIIIIESKQPYLCINSKSYLSVIRGSESAIFVFQTVVFFLGIIYDVIVEPPSVGSMTDEHGHQRPVAFLAYR